MFPHYDPNVPLAQQRYYPNVAIDPAIATSNSRAPCPSSYSASLYAEPESSANQAAISLPDGLGLPKTRKSAAKHEDLPAFSTPGELVAFWALANGQTHTEAATEYNLELSCDDLDAGREIICFDSSTSQSLYTLFAASDAISITRSHPTNDTTTIQISALTMQKPSSSSPLIATIFPKLAELMAIDMSSSVAVEHRLDRKDCTALQIEAVERAHRQEASNLIWDSDSQRYYLIHPTLLEDGSPAAFPIDVAANADIPQEIKIFAPNSTKPLLELSFETLLLSVRTNSVDAYSSLYLLDTLLSTMLVLLLHLHRSRASPSLYPASPTTSAIPFFDPPPTFPPLQSKSEKKERRLTTWPKSFFAQKRRRDSQKNGDDEESAIASTVQGSLPSSPDASMTAELPHAPASTFQIIDPADQRLPKTTRAVLRILYWGFECLFWALGVLVHVLAMVVVGLGKLIKIL
ncbi:MAG: hypothetical protein Q9170_000997 [Blastenia crenularia]